MNYSLGCRLVIVCKIHVFFVERKLLFIAILHPSISATIHSCVDALAVERNCKTAIVPSFVRWVLSLPASASTFNTKILSSSLSLKWTRSVCEQWKVHEQWKYIFFLLLFVSCSPRCIIVIVLAKLCLQDTIYKLYLHTWSPSHCTLCLFACLLIKIHNRA